jgi:peptide/nickel transport system ATP-binding protein
MTKLKTEMSLLQIENLSVNYFRRGRKVEAVRGVSLTLEPGETLGLVGESGCGKSTLALAILRLLPDRESAMPAGRILFEGRDVLGFREGELRRYRGGKAGAVFQDPFSALNPVLTIGEQLEEVLETHAGGRNRALVLERLRQAQIADPERLYASYPHQVSGGQRQRVCLALALLGNPKLLLADEPTTALDVTTQKEILALLDRLQKEHGLAMILITHNLGLVEERTRRLAVMYAGKIVEEGPTASVLSDPKHPYTRALLQSLPRLSSTQRRLPTLQGSPPDLREVPSGCPFHPRCPNVFQPCAGVVPDLEREGDRLVSCHLYTKESVS